MHACCCYTGRQTIPNRRTSSPHSHLFPYSFLSSSFPLLQNPEYNFPPSVPPPLSVFFLHFTFLWCFSVNIPHRSLFLSLYFSLLQILSTYQQKCQGAENPRVKLLWPSNCCPQSYEKSDFFVCPQMINGGWVCKNTSLLQCFSSGEWSKLCHWVNRLAPNLI